VYLDYWGLREKPFENTPDPRFIYYSIRHKEALLNLLYTVNENKGAALLTGDIGCGKTLIARTLISKLDPEEYEVAIITNPRFGEDEFIKEILYQFGVETPAVAKIETIHALNDFLYRNSQRGMKTVLIIDEAQLIINDIILEEIRLLLNFQLDDQFLLTLILIGQPELRDKIRKIPQLDQRIGIRYHLEPLRLEDTSSYINRRLQQAGEKEQIFSDDAVRVIFRHSEGIPRKINTICDLCLVMGSARSLRVIGAEVVQELTSAKGK
jgi:type II secretory pathway predicted ATPase ExeA